MLITWNLICDTLFDNTVSHVYDFKNNKSSSGGFKKQKGGSKFRCSLIMG